MASSKQLRAFFAKLRSGEFSSPNGRIAVSLPLYKKGSGLDTRGSSVRTAVARAIKATKKDQNSRAAVKLKK